MTDTFDPYHKWLGIPPKDQPPHHYRLLGLDLFESDPEVIEAAANRQMTYVQGCATGPYVAHSQRLLNEIAQARLALLDPSRKPAYDEQLRAALAEVAPIEVRPLEPLDEIYPPVTAVPVYGVHVEPVEVPTVDAPLPGDEPVVESSPFTPPVVVPVLTSGRAAAPGAPRGKTRVAIDWRFPVFLVLAAVLVVAGIIIAQRIPEMLKLPEKLPPSSTTGSPPADTDSE